MNKYIIRKANKNNDDKNLNSLFTRIFCPEEVGVLAEIIFNHFPGMEKRYWFIAEDKASSEIVSAFALIPWRWEMQGIQLKVAEMGLVGTHEEHRGKGLMKLLNQKFDETLQEEEFELSVIQGIPGFYDKFGFYYAVAMENHINVPLQLITDNFENKGFSFRHSENKDIPFLIDEDKRYRDNYFISSVRSESNFRYILGAGLKTDCASEFIILQNKSNKDRHYFRINLNGFGTGLIVSEISEGIDYPALCSMLWYCKQKAIQRQKPYIRMNIHHKSEAAEMILSLGARASSPYAWQIKIPDKIRFIAKLKPLLEERLSKSVFRNFSGKFRLNLFTEGIDMTWEKGSLLSVTSSSGEECAHTFNISKDLFPALILGHRTWEELQYIRPDAAPEMMYLYPSEESLSDYTGELAGVLFSSGKSWIYGQY